MLIDPDGRSLPVMAIIPARGGSKGLPGKALKQLAGIPLIAHTVEYAKTIDGVDRVVVTTDDPTIRETALLYGAEAPFIRPSEISDDYSPLDQVLHHALDWYKRKEGFIPRIIVFLYCTNPFRRSGLVDIAIRWGLERRMLLSIKSAARIMSPMENMVYADTPEQPVFSKMKEDKASPAFVHSGNFAIHFPGRDILLDNGKLAPFMVQGTVVIHPVEAIDIDMPQDLALANKVWKSGQHRLPSLRWDQDSLSRLEFHPLFMAPQAYVNYNITPKDPNWRFSQ